MKAGDIVMCKEILKPVGVMGSTLKKYKKFEGFAIVISNCKNISTIMRYDGSIINIKNSFLKVVS